MARSQTRELLSGPAYAKRIGVSREAVRLAIKAGRISTVDGKVDPKVADREWEANTDPSKPRNRITGRPKHRRDPNGPEKPMDLGDGEPRKGKDRTSGYAEARAFREAIQARLAKFELDRKLGTVVDAERVAAAGIDAARKTREQLIGIPDRVAAILTATQDEVEVRRILEEEIDRICEELSGAGRV